MAKLRQRLPDGVEIELWWQDEARIGQKNKITRRWARRGTRPRTAHDQRTKWVYIFGAICPAKGKAAGLIMPYCNSQAMNAHLAEVSTAVDANAHAVVLLDQAGWHTSKKLVVPDNITLMPLPPRAPELNPVENIWQFMRDNWLSNRVFTSYENILAICCEAWNDSNPGRSSRNPKMGPWVLINANWYELSIRRTHGQLSDERELGHRCNSRSGIRNNSTGNGHCQHGPARKHCSVDD